jgi:hypothetical protein
MRTDFDFRRTVTTLTFCGAGIALTPLLAWMTWLIQHEAPLVYRLAMGVVCLLGIVIVGLSFTVAMRQISMKGFGADFSASGGDDEQPAPPVVTTTTTTELKP